MNIKLEQLSAALDISIDDLKERLANVAFSKLFDDTPRLASNWLVDARVSESVPQLQTALRPVDSDISIHSLRVETAIADEPTQRLAIELPASLHQAIKAGCAQRGRTIKEEVVAILHNHYLPSP